MSATLTLELDSFGIEALGRYARQSGRSVPDVIRLAIRYHLADRDTPVAPAWLRDTDAAPASEPIEVELDEKTWAALTAAAKRQGIDAKRLLGLCRPLRLCSKIPCAKSCRFSPWAARPDLPVR